MRDIWKAVNDDVGIDPDGVGQPDPPLVARGGGIGWIGSSFYFIHLDLSLKPHPGLPEGAHDDAWQVHGGGFYRIVKFLVAPAKMPDELTWFKWEAYTTWLSGIALMVVVYYLDAGKRDRDDRRRARHHNCVARDRRSIISVCVAAMNTKARLF